MPHDRLLSTRGAAILALLATLLLWASAPAFSLPEDSQQPIYISSDSAVKDDKRGLTIYQGKVDMQQGSLSIQAEKVTVYAENQQVTKIIANGNPARFKQTPSAGAEDVRAKATTIEYRVKDKKITLTQNASLDQGGSIMTGDNINYDIDAARIEAAGSDSETGRVNVVIPPPQSAPSSNSPSNRSPN